MTDPAVTLDQWRMLVAVVDEGSTHAAGRAVQRSPSAVHHAIGRLQDRLGLKLLERRGRSLVANAAGLAMVDRARRLIAEAADLEEMAADLAVGWEAEISLVVDDVVPPWVLNSALARFEPQARGTRLQIHREVRHGAAQAIARGYDLVLASVLPDGHPPDPLLALSLALVCAPGHALATGELGRLGDALQIVVRDTVTADFAAAPDATWHRASRRWTVPDFATAQRCVLAGFGFALLPLSIASADLAANRLVRLTDPDQDIVVQIHLATPRGPRTGPCARRLEVALREATAVARGTSAA